MQTLEEKNFRKAKGAFLKYLKEADTSEGNAEEDIIKFQLNERVESALRQFVESYGCTMSTRIISRKEQNRIDHRRKNCSQFTTVVVTPEAQKAFLEHASVLNKSSSSKAAPLSEPEESASDEDTTEMVMVPRALVEKLDKWFGRTAKELRDGAIQVKKVKMAKEQD